VPEHNSRATRINATSKSTAAPKLALTTLPRLEPADAATLAARDERERESFTEYDLSGADLAGITFAECELMGLTLTNTQFRAARFIETRLVRSFAPIFTAARTTWRDVLIENPRWGSGEMFDSELNAVHIQGGKIDFLNLRNSRLTDVLIEDCLISELDLGGMRGTRVSLLNCRIGTLDLGGAQCSHVDLRTSDYAQINGLDGLRGATIDDYQLSLLAPVFAAHLGLKVE
jgi:hypothetical protein